MENNPSLRSLEYQVSPAEQGVSSARGGHYPTYGFGASYGNSESWGGPNVGSLNREGESRTIGLTLTVTIISRGETQSRVRQAITTRRIRPYQFEEQISKLGPTTAHPYQPQ